MSDRIVSSILDYSFSRYGLKLLFQTGKRVVRFTHTEGKKNGKTQKFISFFLTYEYNNCNINFCLSSCIMYRLIFRVFRICSFIFFEEWNGLGSGWVNPRF